jgi:rhodanese-related sulfurtransferase
MKIQFYKYLINKAIKMKKNVLCLSILLIMMSITIAQTRLKEDVSCHQALEIIKNHSGDANFVILDVRTPEEFNSGHLEKAILIDFKSANFQDELGKLDKNKTYLVYCRGGSRSLSAIEIMKNMNFKNLYHLYEGFLGWEKGEYKIVTD